MNPVPDPMLTSRPIRILLVEDNAVDAEFTLHALRQAGFEPAWHRVETEPMFLEHLQASVDLVISDFTLPQFSGLRALELRNESGLDTPFILVSGTIGEDLAVEVMKRGASDFLMKDRLARLGASVEHALSDFRLRKEKRQAAEALQESERFNKAILDSLSAHIAIVDETGQILAINEAWRLFAKRNGAAGDRTLIGSNYLEVCDRAGPSSREAKLVAEGIRDVLAGGAAIREVEYPCHSPTEQCWFVARITPFPGSGARRAVVAHENITPRKLAEAAVNFSERHYRLLFENNPAPMWVFDCHTLKFLDVNTAATDHYGYTRDEFLAMTIRDIRPSEAVPALDAHLRMVPEGPSGPAVWRHQKKDGTLIDVEITANDLPFGERSARLVLARDVTEQRRADLSLKLFRVLMDRSMESIEVIDPVSARILDVNEHGCISHGYTREEYLKLTVFDLAMGVTRAAYDENMERLQRERGFIIDGEHRRKDGSIFPVEISLSWVTFDRDYLVAVVRDISERCRAEKVIVQAAETLQRQQTELRILFDLVPALIWFKDTNNTILRVNQRVADSAGRRVEDIEGKPSLEIYPENAERYLEDDLEIVRSGVPKLGVIETVQSAAGGQIWVQTDKVPYRDKNGKVIGIVVMAHDITERKLAEIALRESEEWFRGLIENATDLIAVVDVDGRIDYHSPSAKRLLGYSPEEVLGRPVTDFIHPDDIAIANAGIGRAFADVGPKIIEYRIRHRDGRWRVFQSIGRLMPGVNTRKLVVVNSRDVTEMRALESQFLHTQRLEAIGTLSSGIAHDLNNILAPMLMATSLLRDEVKAPHSRELIMMIEAGAQRGANIIRQLLTFSRGIEGERVSVQWRHLVREVAAIARETFPREIEISERVARDLRTVLGDATQLHQVLLNLCINARDAMPRGGQLILLGKNVELTAEQLSAHPAAKPGHYVLVEVTDTGTGIPHDVIDRIFDPFFTTKEIGKGTGLGLSTAMGIVKSHGGFILVQSAVGKGTTFQIYLPADDGTASEIALGAAPAAPIGRGELILLVDDENAIRFATMATLQRWNYRVLAAANGALGLALFREHKAEVKLVVTDLMMPVMGGQAMIQEMRALAPHLRIIAGTGLDPGEKRAELEALGVTTILMKPYTPQALHEAIIAELREGSKFS